MYVWIHFNECHNHVAMAIIFAQVGVFTVHTPDSEVSALPMCFHHFHVNEQVK